MKIARLSGLLLLAVMVVGFAIAPSASAASGNPLFTPASGQTVTGTSGLGYLIGAGVVVSCEKDVYAGVVSSSLLIGNLKIHYLGCKVLKGEVGKASGCEVSSINNGIEQAAGLILTNTLHAILGLILPSKETGLLFLPQVGKIFTTFAKSTHSGTEPCSEETAVSGSVAGSVEPVNKTQFTGTIKIGLTGGIANAKDFDLTHGLGLVKPNLLAFGEAAGLEQTDSALFSVETEVT